MSYDFDVTEDDDVVDNAEPEATETEVSQSENDTPDDTQDDVVEGETEQADDGEKSEDDKSDDDTDEKPKKGGASERIRQLVAEKKAAEAEAERLRQELQQPKQDKQQSDDGAPKPPSMDDFDIETDEGLQAFFDAQSQYEEQAEAYKIEQHLTKREQAKQAEAKAAEITNKFKERFEANEDFKTNFEQLNVAMQDKPVEADPSELFSGDDLIDIVEYLAGDLDAYYDLAGKTVAQQYAEFGKIHAQIQSRKQTPQVKRQSKAPPPPNHTKSNAPISRSFYDKSDDEIMRARGL